MENKVIWQRCPKCGQWCIGVTGVLAHALNGILKAGEFGENKGKTIGGKLLGSVGEKIGGTIGKFSTAAVSFYPNLAKGFIENDGYFFECKCGEYWSTDGLPEKQNAEYGAELAKEFMSLPFAQRKFLFICDELGLIPSSFRVLPIASIPSDIIFPTGGPFINTLYVCHPYRPDHYYPYETHQIEILRDELREFRKIMRSLGARRIDYSDLFESSKEENTTYNQDNHGKVSYGGDSLDASHSIEKRQEMARHIRSGFQGSEDCELGDKPQIPNGLVWYNNREDWRDACEDRLAGRLIHQVFTISSFASEITNQQETNQIEAEYKSVAAASGTTQIKKTLSLKKETEISWNVSVDFYPLSDYNKKEIGASALINNGTASILRQTPPNKFNIVWIMGLVIVALIAVIIGMILL